MDEHSGNWQRWGAFLAPGAVWLAPMAAPVFAQAPSAPPANNATTPGNTTGAGGVGAGGITAPPAAKSYIVDSVLVVALMGLALFAICRSSRRL